ncbi:hypothetical protein F5J12DRAFT_903915 [Pisolithus orientalis]|uniref:uncharacterized protein n=1 Tax=Pisolithus orientalis TaxID=936130 RepID=UPI0022249AEC|nr:uncharacterized protein F5J12DRAFT_903915 [Pisolithus orientalis]KAI6025792.1 hypothetical protein F5J12DRAFT_903915 [Pisolithus orientalis]
MTPPAGLQAHPPCPAKEHLTAWKPTNHQTPPLPFTSADTQCIYKVITHTWSDTTRETYGSGLLAFHTFDQHAPASPDLISFIISTMASLYANSTIVNYLNGHLGVSIGLAFPIAIITKLQTSLNLNTPLHAAVFACLTTIFFATVHTGEFTVPSLKAFNLTIHITPQNVSKDVNWAKQDGPTDPQLALAKHFAINNPPVQVHLFMYCTKNGHSPLTRHTFLKTPDSALKTANLPPLKGHGICIGSTLEYLLRNVPFNIIKVKGHWASNAFLIYLCCHAQTLAPYMQSEPNLHNAFNEPDPQAVPLCLL